MEQFYNSMWQIQNVTLREDNGEQTMKGHLQKKKNEMREREKKPAPIYHGGNHNTKWKWVLGLWIYYRPFRI